MEASFWHERWEKNEIGFHEHAVNPLLTNYFHLLHVPGGARVFLPLCGKTLDIRWLLANGYSVVGVELSRIAIEQLFASLDEAPIVTTHGAFEHFSANNFDIFVGDYFALSAAILGQVDAVYDRAALIALPDKMRQRYTGHLQSICRQSPQLIVSLAYDQSVMAGPPFSVGAEKIREYYSRSYDVKLLSTKDIPGGLKGKCEATESAWLLQPLSK